MSRIPRHSLHQPFGLNWGEKGKREKRLDQKIKKVSHATKIFFNCFFLFFNHCSFGTCPELEKPVERPEKGSKKGCHPTNQTSCRNSGGFPTAADY